MYVWPYCPHPSVTILPSSDRDTLTQTGRHGVRSCPSPCAKAQKDSEHVPFLQREQIRVRHVLHSDLKWCPPPHLKHVRFSLFPRLCESAGM